MELKEQPIIKCDIVNANFRYYSEEAMKDCLESIEGKPVPIYLGEPSDITPDELRCTIGAATNLRIENGLVKADVVIPDRAGAEELKGLIERGTVSFATSVYGSLTPTFSSNFDTVHYVVDPKLQSLYVTDKSSYRFGKVIDSFSGENRFLSNFAACRIIYNGLEFNSVENAYQAQKCPERAAEFTNISAKEAKALGKEVEVRPDWDDVKDTVMRELVTQKFANDPIYRKKLLQTYYATIVEGNYWHDNYWGSCNCEKCGDVGHNKLGKILMEVREILFKEENNEIKNNVKPAPEDAEIGSDYDIEVSEKFSDDEQYDSTNDTKAHKLKVRSYMAKCVSILDDRAEHHDDSKLVSPEKEYFDEYTPQLALTTYGSPEYQESLKGLKVALDHHYSVNTHHPEHYKNGINDMDLLDLIELICDWKASSERNSNGDIYRSLELSKERFGISEQLYSILKNTVDRFLDGNTRRY